MPPRTGFFVVVVLSLAICQASAATRVAAAVSTLYYLSEDHSAAQTLVRSRTQVMWDAVSNELKEFWPDIRRKMHYD